MAFVRREFEQPLCKGTLSESFNPSLRMGRGALSKRGEMSTKGSELLTG